MKWFAFCMNGVFAIAGAVFFGLLTVSYLDPLSEWDRLVELIVYSLFCYVAVVILYFNRPRGSTN